MKRRLATLIAIAICGIGAAGAAGILWINTPSPPLSNRDLAAMQREAERACKCSRQSNDPKAKERCWERSADIIEGQEPPEVMITACTPISTELKCFGGGDRCYTSGYALVLDAEGLDSPIICTAEEAQTLETIWAENFVADAPSDPKEQQRVFENAAKAVEKAARDIAANRPVTRSRLQKGCVG